MVPKKILPLPPWKLSVYFTITNTICKERVNFLQRTTLVTIIRIYEAHRARNLLIECRILKWAATKKKIVSEYVIFIQISWISSFFISRGICSSYVDKFFLGIVLPKRFFPNSSIDHHWLNLILNVQVSWSPKLSENTVSYFTIPLEININLSLIICLAPRSLISISHWLMHNFFLLNYLYAFGSISV